jgi:formyl-CoA transferase
VTPKFSRTPGGVRWTGAWEPGADNAAVFGELLGHSDQDLERLEATGAICAR